MSQTPNVSKRLSELVFDFLEVPMVIHVIAWALCFGMGILVGAAIWQ